MNTAQRIIKNTSVLLIAQVGGKILSLFYVMYAARYLGAKGFGTLSFALAFTGIFGAFAGFGLDELSVREIARNKSLASKYLFNLSLIRILLSIVTFGAIVLVINLLGYPAETKIVVYLIGLSIIFYVFNQIFNSFFQGFERMEFQSFGNILSSVLMLLGILYAIKLKAGVIGFASVYCAVNFVIVLYSISILKWKFSNWFLTPPKIDWHFWLSSVKTAFPFFFSSIVYLISLRIDMVMLSMMKGDVSVGWYSAAYRLMQILLLIPATFTGAIYPVFSNLYVSSRKFLKIAYQNSFKYLAMVAFPIAIGVTILADKIILTIYQSNFTNSIIVLRILIWTVPIIFLDYIFGTMFASINKQRLALKISFSCMVLNIILNSILIPKYSYAGAASATLLTAFLSFTMGHYFLSKTIHKLPIHKLIVKPLVASLIMGASIILLSGTNLFLLILIGAIVYVIALFILRAFSKEDYHLLKRVIDTRWGEVEK